MPDLARVLKDQVSLLLTRAFAALGALGAHQRRRSLSPEQCITAYSYPYPNSYACAPEQQSGTRARPGSFVADDLVDIDTADPLDEFEFVAERTRRPNPNVPNARAGAGVAATPIATAIGGVGVGVGARAGSEVGGGGGQELLVGCNIPIVQRVLRITRVLLLNYMELLVRSHSHSHSQPLSHSTREQLVDVYRAQSASILK